MKPRLNLKSYSVTRSAVNAPVNGRAVASTITTIPIKANVQPADGKTIKALPEFRQTEDIRHLFTATELYVTGRTVDGIKYDADRIAIKGEVFEVFKVGEWGDGDTTGHYECLVSRQVKP